MNEIINQINVFRRCNKNKEDDSVAVQLTGIRLDSNLGSVQFTETRSGIYKNKKKNTSHGCPQLHTTHFYNKVLYINLNSAGLAG